MKFAAVVYLVFALFGLSMGQMGKYNNFTDLRMMHLSVIPENCGLPPAISGIRQAS